MTTSSSLHDSSSSSYGASHDIAKVGFGSVAHRDGNGRTNSGTDTEDGCSSKLRSTTTGTDSIAHGDGSDGTNGDDDNSAAETVVIDSDTRCNGRVWIKALRPQRGAPRHAMEVAAPQGLGESRLRTS